MPTNIFRNFSKNSEKKIDTSLFVQKHFSRTNYKEAKIEEDIHLTKKFKIKKLPCPQKNSDAAYKSYVDSGLNDPSIIRNTAHVDFDDKNFIIKNLLK